MVSVTPLHGLTVSTLNPIVGIVVTSSSNFNLYRIVVLPANNIVE